MEVAQYGHIHGMNTSFDAILRLAIVLMSRTLPYDAGNAMVTRGKPDKIASIGWEDERDDSTGARGCQANRAFSVLSQIPFAAHIPKLLVGPILTGVTYRGQA